MSRETIFEEMKEVPDNKLEELHFFIRNLIDNPEPKDWWDEISDAEKQSIERGLEDIENARVIPHEEVMAKYAGRF